MAKDDYHVIVYKILAYLYVQLKNGQPVDQEMLMAKGKLFDIPETYWQYIMSNLCNSGYVMGATATMWGKEEIVMLEDMKITPAGIEYLTENSFLQKVKHFLKDAGDIISPFIK